ncbi:hypothetical protein QR680_004864 [Steinernema hermaphroditum]|uniref:Uncharacterized protein n=1 Tax=Steinernema hermaphroditum TaxID=289476 RepID=A0AA39HSD5_9BILA|nr:hypothetical protein QR680_004864 [Steinernema hermaphroditum]
MNNSQLVLLAVCALVALSFVPANAQYYYPYGLQYPYSYGYPYAYPYGYPAVRYGGCLGGCGGYGYGYVFPQPYMLPLRRRSADYGDAPRARKHRKDDSVELDGGCEMCDRRK